jgi:hypothetical protein
MLGASEAKRLLLFKNSTSTWMCVSGVRVWVFGCLFCWDALKSAARQNVENKQKQRKRNLTRDTESAKLESPATQNNEVAFGWVIATWVAANQRVQKSTLTTKEW